MAAKKYDLLTRQSSAAVLCAIVLLCIGAAQPRDAHAASIDDFSSTLDTTVYRLATQKNDASAQYLVGRKYLLGKNVDKNIPEAIRWLEMAANQDHKKAQYLLGRIYLYGDGVMRNYVYALDYLKRAAENNHTDAQYELGNYYALEDTGNQQFSLAAKWYEKAAQRMHKNAMLALARLQIEGKGVKQNVEQGKSLARQASLNGNQEADRFLEHLLSNGAQARSLDANASADDKDTVNALPDHAAARNGDSTAQFNLAMAYLKGERGAPHDPQTAMQWFSNAAQQEHGQAQYELGVLFRDGTGVDADPRAAQEWFKRAAANGVAEASKAMDELAEKTSPVSVAIAKPEVSSTPPARSKTTTFYEIGNMHLHGQGVDKDPEAAAKWFIKAAQAGSADAQYELGEMYVTGNGVEKDVNKAKDWYEKAALAGSDKALQRLDALGAARPSAAMVTKTSAPAEISAPIQLAKTSRIIETSPEINTAQPASLPPRSADDLLTEGLLHLNSRDSKKDVAKGLDLITRAAERNNLEAQLELARLYLKGKEVDINYSKAIEWYTRAAQQGDAQAQFKLGDMYKKGVGVATDNAEAIKWYRMAASQGHRDARSRLGGCRIC